MLNTCKFDIYPNNVIFYSAVIFQCGEVTSVLRSTYLEILDSWISLIVS